MLIACGLLGTASSPALAQEQECWTTEPSMSAGFPQWPEAPQMVIDPQKTYVATIDTNRGDIVAELDASAAPNTVNNFVCLARAGYYEVTVFHRIIAGFMIQGGDPTGTGGGNPGYQFDDELPSGETPYVRGTLAMANAGANTNGSQFFIVQTDQTDQFKPNYSIFGRVTEGLDVLDTINQAPVGPNPRSGEPSAPQVTLGIQSITILEDGQPMDALAGTASAASAGDPGAGVADGVVAQAQPTVADTEDDGNTVWIASGAGLGVGAVAVLGYGLYRRSRTAAPARTG